MLAFLLTANNLAYLSLSNIRPALIEDTKIFVMAVSTVRHSFSIQVLISSINNISKSIFANDLSNHFVNKVNRALPKQQIRSGYYSPVNVIVKFHPQLQHYSGRAFWGLLTGGGGGKQKFPSLPKICYTSYNDETWHTYNLPKKPKKYMNHVTHPMSSADINIFSAEISKFCYIKK